MESEDPKNLSSIFNLYTKYRYCTFNNIISSDTQLFKFKDRVINYNKIFGDMESRKFQQKEPESIQILVKEGKEKKVYELDVPEEEEEQKTIIEKKTEKTEPKKPGEKTFVVLGGYPDIVAAIAKRGYKQTTDVESKNYDFLYTLKNVDIPFTELKPNQLVNHYWKANQITRKSGLLKNLRNLYFKNVCIDNFYPRAYELNDKNDLEDFIEDFKTNKAICILKKAKMQNFENVNKEQVLTALNILKKKINFITCNQNIEKRFENIKTKPLSYKEIKNTEFVVPTITNEEWEIISDEDMKIYYNEIFQLEKSKMLPIPPEREHLHKVGYGKKVNKKITNTNKETNKKNITKNNNQKNYIMTEEEKKLEQEIKENFKKQQENREIERKKFEQKLLEEEIARRQKEAEDLEKKEQEKKKLEEESKKPKPKLTKEEKEQKWKQETFLNNTTSNERPESKPTIDNVQNLNKEITEILQKISENLPESVLDGDRNVWIVKPGGLSRGRGINCIDQLNDILSNVKPCNQTIIQKYIENPLVVEGRKFDIRQWVLVSDLNPLTVWLFDTPYVRFGAEDYHIDDFKNVFSQLTGNSIAKHSEKFNESHIEGDMWEIEQFSEYLKKKYGRECWKEIQEKIKKIVIFALESAKHKLFQRKNNFETFGFDIMIDDKLNVYLIEINAAPDWTYSTKVTEKLVKIASDDIMKVVLDLAQENNKPVEQRQKVDTGRFKQIFCSTSFPKYESNLVNNYK